ncbi:hypothetical protein QAD02_010264 [Eretmocerus hayati]|uniref:Uncharacterized protein n=1 Tax=Eretmocerus hayati TaxID=131215 RepID=A0ACC2NC01_9HYME|nr:hypothetical protein QAD02_010264 [Eretmocerus hayati]
MPAVSSGGDDEKMEKIKGYHVMDLLGKGGFACVYRAKCKRTGMEVAIKMIDKKNMNEREMVDRVKQEVSIHSRLKHPSILELYDFFEDHLYVYLVLELCHNGELQRYMKERGLKTLSEPEAGRIIQQVVEGLLYLQSHRILHRDLSLSNLLLTHDLQVKISDFGLATQLTDVYEKHFTLCGTPNFISPEVATRSSQGLEVDVWSLGCMLYTLLVGKPPFDTNEVKSTLTRVVMGNYAMPDNLSENAKDLIDKLLRKNPKERIKLREILEHDFITTIEKPRSADRFRFSRLSGDNLDSGLGRTLSSCGRQRTRTRSEERIMNTPILYNGFGTAISARSEPLMEPSPSSVHNSHHKRYSACQQNREEPVLAGIPPPPPPRGSQVFLQGEPSLFAGGGGSFSGSRHQRSQEGHHELTAATTPNVESRIEPISKNDTAPDESTEEINSKKLEVPPLNTTRLQPTRHRTKSAILTILSNGEVCVEFIKKKNDKERISEVFRISNDGLRVILYKPTEALQPGNQPPDLPARGADSIYSYESLPIKHHKKYQYAARFIGLVRAKTPKITYYTNLAKSLFMENGPRPDCETHFYDGIKVLFVEGVVKITEKSGQTYMEGEIPKELQEYYDHYQECYKLCLLLDSSLASLESATGRSIFPAIYGRKPSPLKDMTPPLQGKENISGTTTSPPVMPSFDATCSMVSSMINSRSRKTNSSRISQSKGVRVNIPGIGTAHQTPSGDIRVEYADGSVLTMTPNGGILYRSPSGNVLPFNKDQNQSAGLPSVVKEKLHHLPNIVKLLVQRASKNIR